jgi:tight adherence protein B
MEALLLSGAAAYGTFLLYTSFALGWRGLGIGPASSSRRAVRWSDILRNALGGETVGVSVPEVVAATTTLLVAGGAVGFALFGSVLPALAVGAFAASFPVTSLRTRHRARLETAREAWPRMIEEIRLQTGALGRSVPQALFEVGRRGPEEMRPAFAAAEREWMVSTDFARTVALLKSRLADPTADATCETLLVAHEIGGSELDRRLEALVDDRIQELQGRRDARAKQAGVRFARRFVLIVPAGMAVAGLSIGYGRAAYETPAGQLAVGAGIGAVVACWLWAGRLLRLPAEERVFDA